MMRLPVAGAICLSVLLCKVYSFEHGAPFSSCANLLVKHARQPTHTPSPYVIQLSQNSYSPGENIQVTLESPKGKPLRGYVLIARRLSGDTEENVGTFSEWTPDIRPIQFYSTPADQPNCLTHIDNSDKMTISATWTAPAKSVGDLVFRASVVQNFDTFWHDVRSDVVTANEVNADEPYMAEISPDFQPMSLTACGKSKGCFLYPDGCDTVESCMYAVTYQPTADQSRIEFEMMGRTQAYVSVGFSSDVKMGHDLTLTCIAKEGKVSMENGDNPHLFNVAHLRVNVGDIQLARVEDKVLCRFTKLVDEFYLSSRGKYVLVNSSFSLRGPQYIFVAWGDVYPDSMTMKHHKELPLVSSKKVNLFETKISAGRNLHKTLQAHASLGIIGWIWLAGISITIVRHYRSVFSKTLLGTIGWLQIHRCVMYLVVGMSVVCVIIIVVYLKAWTEYGTAHAIVGLCAMGMGLISLVQGLCRPHPMSSKRPYYNWIHRFSGVAAHFLAVAAVLLGFQIDLVIDDLGKKQTVLILIWLGLHVAFDIFMERFPWKYEKPVEKPVETNSMSIEDNNPRSSSPRHGLIALGIYVLASTLLLLVSLYYLLST